jgi:hypothetical protein
MENLDNKNTLTDAASQKAEAVDVAPLELRPKKRKFITAGEHIHKWSTYIVLDWIVNTGFGVTFSYWGKFTEAGKKIWSQPITNFFDKALTPFIKNPEVRQKSAGFGNMFASIITGGMFIVPLLMGMENNKVKKSVAQFFDRMIYGKDKVENDPKFQQAYREMDAHPRKGFIMGMASRFAALAPELTIILIPATKQIANRLLFNHLEHASEFLGKKLGFGPASFKKLPLAEGEKRWKFIHENIALDFGLAGPYALMHAVFYSVFANIAFKIRSKDKSPAEPVNKATDTPLQDAVKMESPAEPQTAKFADKAEKKTRPAPKESYVVSELFRKAEPAQPAIS